MKGFGPFETPETNEKASYLVILDVQYSFSGYFEEVRHAFRQILPKCCQVKKNLFHLSFNFLLNEPCPNNNEREKKEASNMVQLCPYINCGYKFLDD